MKNGILVTPKFNIGQVVYYNLPESEEGLVIDIIYKVRPNQFEYLIGSSFGESHWADEVEISDHKIF